MITNTQTVWKQNVLGIITCITVECNGRLFVKFHLLLRLCWQRHKTS